MKEIVGYWGSGNISELKTILTRIFSQASVEKELQQVNYQKHDCFGALAQWSFTNNYSISNEGIFKTKEFCQVSLSAAGISELADAVIKFENQRLVLSRDCFGRIPLYWFQKEQVIWFATRIQLLLPVLDSPQVSIPGFYGYNCFSYVPTPLSPIENIFTVPAGCEIVWEINQNHQIQNHQIQNCYRWQETEDLIKDEKTAILQLQDLLKNSIYRQLSNLPQEVGVFLSGGLDSSVVAALLVQAGVKVKAYALDFGEYGISELPFAEVVAKHLEIPLVKVDATPKRIKSAMKATVKALDLPFGDGVTIPIYLLCEAASKETSVIFNGEGGDQLFAGWTNKPLIAAGIYNSEDFNLQYLRTFHRLYGYEGQCFQSELISQIKNINPETWIAEALNPEFINNILARLRRASLMLKGAQNIHPRATNLGKAFNLRVRSPFCDLPLAEWSFALSGELCLQGNTEKYILKKAVESWLPSEIVWREKRGMGVPLNSWCLGELWGEVSKRLNQGILKFEGFYQEDIILKVLEGEIGGQIRQRRIGEVLWLLLMWEMWRVEVLGEKVEGKVFDYQLLWLRVLQKFKK
ncbi:asparagine synthase (glutamine-hydrolyzing) [Rivularia sp. PCC 7116]|uniref:asparagine synthetase B family protein n=1 Tax=Rivularia sp. PCC 7116 TaxID=373994 RepID=UPI00029EE031|nr:asparagine synthetase B family protein [Rivularia sp. PCC 7116]AFY54082.1 asparagine synthase (glutamine-hydrolyzing) [Rivularia sp. PCC 7116]